MKEELFNNLRIYCGDIFFFLLRSGHKRKEAPLYLSRFRPLATQVSFGLRVDQPDRQLPVWEPSPLPPAAARPLAPGGRNRKQPVMLSGSHASGTLNLSLIWS